MVPRSSPFFSFFACERAPSPFETDECSRPRRVLDRLPWSGAGATRPSGATKPSATRRASPTGSEPWRHPMSSRPRHPAASPLRLSSPQRATPLQAGFATPPRRSTKHSPSGSRFGSSHRLLSRLLSRRLLSRRCPLAGPCATRQRHCSTRAATRTSRSTGSAMAAAPISRRTFAAPPAHSASSRECSAGFRSRPPPPPPPPASQQPVRRRAGSTSSAAAALLIAPLRGSSGARRRRPGESVQGRGEPGRSGERRGKRRGKRRGRGSRGPSTGHRRSLFPAEVRRRREAHPLCTPPSAPPSSSSALRSPLFDGTLRRRGRPPQLVLLDLTMSISTTVIVIVLPQAVLLDLVAAKAAASRSAPQRRGATSATLIVCAASRVEAVSAALRRRLVAHACHVSRRKLSAAEALRHAVVLTTYGLLAAKDCVPPPAERLALAQPPCEAGSDPAPDPDPDPRPGPDLWPGSPSSRRATLAGGASPLRPAKRRRAPEPRGCTRARGGGWCCRTRRA